MSYDYEGIERRLRALTALVGEAVPDLAPWFDEFLDAGEYGLAVEIVTEGLRPDMPRDLGTELAAGLLAEAERMELPHETLEPLRACARGGAPGAT